MVDFLCFEKYEGSTECFENECVACIYQRRGFQLSYMITNSDQSLTSLLVL